MSSRPVWNKFDLKKFIKAILVFPPVSPVLRGLWQEASHEFEINLEHTMKSQLRKMGFQDSINGVLCGDFFHSGKKGI